MPTFFFNKGQFNELQIKNSPRHQKYKMKQNTSRKVEMLRKMEIKTEYNDLQIS